MDEFGPRTPSKELQRALRETGSVKVVIDPWDNAAANRERMRLNKAGGQIGAKVSTRRSGNAIVGTVTPGQEPSVNGSDDVGIVMAELRKSLTSFEALLDLRRPTKADVLAGIARHRDSLRAAELMARGLED